MVSPEDLAKVGETLQHLKDQHDPEVAQLYAPEELDEDEVMRVLNGVFARAGIDKQLTFPLSYANSPASITSAAKSERTADDRQLTRFVFSHL